MQFLPSDVSHARREFLESSAAAVAVAGTAGSAEPEKELKDGPRAKGFSPLALNGNTDFEALAESGISDLMANAVPNAPRGNLVCWGLPFEVSRPTVLRNEAVVEMNAHRLLRGCNDPLLGLSQCRRHSTGADSW